MTISRYHKLFVLSAIMCAVPVSDAYCGPLFTRAWSMVSSFFTRPQYSFGTLPRNRATIDLSDSYHVVNTSNNSTGSSYSPDSGWISTNRLLAGAAVVGAAVATGYGLYTWYAGYKQREESRRAEQALKEEEKQALKEEEKALEGAEKCREKAYEEEEKRAIAEQKRKKELSERGVETGSLRRENPSQNQAEQAVAEQKRKRRLCKPVRDVMNGLLDQVEQKLMEEAFCVVDSEIVLSDLVKNCSLCNQLTVTYLNVLCEDKGKEDKKQVITFLSSDTSKDKELWNNRNILDVISKEDPHFVIQRLEYIAKGEQYVKEITSGNADNVPQSNQKEYLDSLISITWYLYAKALQKGDGFSASGSFNVESKALMNFFIGYYHQVREWHKDFCETGRAWTASYTKCGTNKLGDHPFAYERCSSHLKGLEVINYGIDIRFASEVQETQWFDSMQTWFQSMTDFFVKSSQEIKTTLVKQRELHPEEAKELEQMQCALPKMEQHFKNNTTLTSQLSQVQPVCMLLPDGKAHILCIPYDAQNGRFLLKPERYGTTVFDLSDAIAHGFEFLHGSKGADYDYTRREKIKKDVAFKKLQERYKEHVPGQGFHKSKLKTDSKVTKSTDNTEKILTFGCQYMLEQLDHWLDKNNLGRFTREKLELLKHDLLELYTDHHDIRFAHEVVFKEADFR